MNDNTAKSEAAFRELTGIPEPKYPDHDTVGNPIRCRDCKGFEDCETVIDIDRNTTAGSCEGYSLADGASVSTVEHK
jgi:hypothetical protein